MRTTRLEKLTRGLQVAILAGLTTFLLLPSVRADGLEEYTGLTRSGNDGTSKNPIRPVADKNKTAFGGTVYYMVLDRADGTPGNTFGVNLDAKDSKDIKEGKEGKDGKDDKDGKDGKDGKDIKDIDSLFIPGSDSPIKKLDTSARYLYLYMVVHDNPDARDSSVREAYIRLLVDPRHITSWGYFAKPAAKAGEATGVAFTAPEKGTGQIRAVSLENKPGPKENADPAPYHKAATEWGFRVIPMGGAPVATKDGTKEYGRVPTDVQLIAAASFVGAPKLDIKKIIERAALGLKRKTGVRPSGIMDDLYPSTGLNRALVGRPLLDSSYTDTDSSSREDRHPAIKATWARGIELGTRSTLFGFTSNLPPTYEDVRLKGNKHGVALASLDAPDPATPVLATDGEVPTPIAFESESPAGTAGTSFGGIGGTSGSTGGGGGFPGGAGGIGTAPASGGGTGGGLGGGSGGGQATPSQNQNQTPTITVGNQTVTVKQQQQQQQKQKQQQKQQQKQEQKGNCCHQPNVVPAPPALLLGLLGAPIFYVFLRRRPTTPVVKE